MKISYKTLQKLITFEETPEELEVLLTNTGLEVEGIEEVLAVEGGLKGLVIGQVITCKPHPNADKLKTTTVDVGDSEPLAIVCGAPNVAEGQKVVVATVGATLYPKEGEPFKIKKSKIRGELSQGMLCAVDEIGLGEGHEGILVLNTDLKNGTEASVYFGLESDYIVEIGLTPNRADGASHYGVARDIKAVNGNNIFLPDLQNIVPGKHPGTITVEVKDGLACPRFCGLEIRGVKVRESPKWLKSFLISIGLKPINNIVDISNYVCHFLGQPMHVFDADKIEGKKVIVQKPEKGAKLTTLDDIERTFNGSELAICDGHHTPMALAGVMGGADFGVGNFTKNIFLEVAYFNPDIIRKSATYHALNTDASFRYERGTDPYMPPYAIRFAAMLVEDLAGGSRCDMFLEHYPSPVEPKLIDTNLEYINSLIGKDIESKKIEQILERLDIKTLSNDEGKIKLQVPPYRVDVTREADIVEEVLRIYGFGQISESNELSSSFLSQFPIINAEDQQQRISEILAASGFNEIQSLSIVNPSQNLLVDDRPETTVKLLNPLSEELSEMRKSLLFSGLESLAYNINRRQKDLKLFEFGRIYTKENSPQGTIYHDKQVLGTWLTGNKETESWYTPTEKVNFYDLRKAVEKVLASLKVSYTTDVSNYDHFVYGLSYRLHEREVAVVGKVKDTLLKKAGIKQEVFYAQLDWAYLLKKYKPEISYTEISKFPAVKRDLSLVLDQKVSFNEVKKVALKTEKKLLEAVRVFDVYEGDKIGEGKKAYAISFILQDKSKTLQDKVIDKVMSKLILNFEKELKAVIRK